MHHRAKFYQNRTSGCANMAIFDVSRWRLSTIFNFQNREFITPSWDQMLYRAKIRQNRSYGWRDIVIFRYFKIAVVRHLGFVGHILGPTTHSQSSWKSCQSLSLAIASAGLLPESVSTVTRRSVSNIDLHALTQMEPMRLQVMSAGPDLAGGGLGPSSLGVTKWETVKA